jgi:hypothetical protein
MIQLRRLALAGLLKPFPFVGQGHFPPYLVVRLMGTRRYSFSVSGLTRMTPTVTVADTPASVMR